ncbi:MAG TPA: TadE/TadG family type IV pilus assembly protein [Beijerinckiaceae bacterium]|nr:TadE/TadG family type IV pilus assembly protein [Beijerinckiaceae bacterium]
MRNAASFRDDIRGNIAITFALCLVPLMLTIGVAINYSGGVLLQTKLQTATDATVLALALHLSDTPAQLTAAAQSYMNASDVGVGSTIVSGPTLSAGGSEVCMTTAAENPASFFKMSLINVSTTACAASSGTNLEIALVLDNSGSMEDSAGGEAKIDALKAAATNFVNSLFANHPTPSGQTTPALRMSLVPFQDAVAISSADTQNGTANWIDVNGQSSWEWNGMIPPSNLASGLTPGTIVNSRLDIYKWLVAAGGSKYAWRGCFESLPYPMNVQDVTPSISNPDSLYVPTFAPDEPDKYKNSNLFSNTYLTDDSSSCIGTPPISPNDPPRQERICKYEKPGLSPLKYYWSGPNYACNALPLMRLTTSESSIQSEISRMVALGDTDLHEAMMWGWRTLSPNGPFQDGSPYNSTKKIIVMMTDGMNFVPAITASMNNGLPPIGGSGYGALGYAAFDTGRIPAGYQTVTSQANGNQSPAMDELTREACANARAAGISIYTIGFQAVDIISASGQQLLKDCAGDPSHFYLVTDEPSLAKALASISLGASAPHLVK